MCKNIKSQKNYRILLYTIMEKQRSEVVSGVNVDPMVLAGLTAKAACDSLMELFMVVGLPEVIVSDRGTNFVAN